MPEAVLETLSEAPTSAQQSFGADSDRLAADMLERFRAATDGFYASLDVAALNLCCGLGLPGAENLNIDKHLATIDEMARRVRLETELHYYRFLENPAEFENSQGYFCILMLITVLQQDCGVRYNPARIHDPKFQDPDCFAPDFSDSRDLFIHGILDGPGGTCASMPVLTVAMCRRLGYPVKLVQAPGHLFARWDDPYGRFNGVPDRFNIDCSSRGFACHPDEHYRKWPRPWSKHEQECGRYVKSLTPREAIASFLSTRGYCLWDNGRLGDALRAFCLATIFAPDDPRYDWQLCDSYQKYRTEIVKKTQDEASKVCLTIDEQIDLQKAIVRGHLALLRDGKPGLPLADFGIKETVIHSPLHAAVPAKRDTANVEHSGYPQLRYNSGRSKTGVESVAGPALPTLNLEMAEPPAVQAAREQMGRAKLLNQFNQDNQRRLQRGSPFQNSPYVSS